MRLLYILAILVFSISNTFGQEQDTTVYKILGEMARFPGCEGLDTTMQVKNQCAQANLMAFLYGNIVYPWEARENGNEGTVVVSFIVEKDGYISTPKLLKDIGGGCGDEAMRVLNGMNDALKKAGLRWRPGLKDERIVRSLYTLPVKFRLQDPLDYVMVGTDTSYIVMDDSLKFEGGFEAFASHINDNLKYPSSFKDSCLIGDMDVQILVQPDGTVKVLDVMDYCGLGFDFTFEAIQVSTSTFGKWTPATRLGRNVPTTFNYALAFVPEEGHCQQTITDYQKATQLANEGSILYNEGNKEEAYVKLSQAVDLFPNNANFLYLRGQAYMNDERMEEACLDLTRVKEIVPIGLVNDILPLICGVKKEADE